MARQIIAGIEFTISGDYSVHRQVISGELAFRLSNSKRSLTYGGRAKKFLPALKWEKWGKSKRSYSKSSYFL
ncbi:3-hydroxy-3-methylglutaryl-coenzyme A reductase [Fusarium oxysporum f. sp. albedinis]|nr:3-hydroxy-3-methylglutaryl-coenzyme A reductase [Fusarium oxysporum f. sp. albedinis]